jgi:hypothetical protein
MFNKLWDSLVKNQESINIIASVGQIIQVLYNILSFIVIFVENPFSADIKSILLNLNPIFKHSLLILFIVSSYLLINDIYKKILFTKNIISYDFGIKDVINKHTHLINYAKIIPSTIIIQHIYDIFFKRAKKWSGDVHLTSLELVIDVNEMKIVTYLNVSFFSPSKKASISFSSKDFKIEKDQNIRVDQIEYHDYLVKEKPFFTNRLWRKFIISILKLKENELAGHNLDIRIKSWVSCDAYLYINPFFIPTRKFSYFLKNNEAYSDVAYNNPIFKIK